MINLALGLAISAGIVALPAFVLRQYRPPYLMGLSSSVVASLVIGLVTEMAPYLLEAQNLQFSAIYVSPLIEETVRLVGLVVLFKLIQSIKHVGFAFGLAWGAFELCLTWLDLAVQSSGGNLDLTTLYDIVAPLAPFAMSIALSVVASRMLITGTRLSATWAILAACHILSNASAFAWDYNLPVEYGLALVGVRLVIFMSAAWLFGRG